MHSIKPRGFTLIEILIVAAIIALLVAILLPLLGRAREAARQIVCANNQRQILLAMTMYADHNRGYLPLPVRWEGGLQLGGVEIWMPGMNATDITPGVYDYDNGTIWPYIGLKSAGARKDLFACPSDPEPRLTLGGRPRNFSYTFNWELYYSPFQIQAALVQRTPIPVGVRLQNIRGTEHKMLVIETKAPIWEVTPFMGWSASGGLTLPGGHDASTYELTDRHSGRANIGMADGHVELVDPLEISRRQSASATILRAYSVPVKYDYYVALPH